MNRICIFIDGSNFYHALKNAGLSVGVDLGKLAAKLTGPDRRHVHTYYYNTPLIRPAATIRSTMPRISAADPCNASSTRSVSSLT